MRSRKRDLNGKARLGARYGTRDLSEMEWEMRQGSGPET